MVRSVPMRASECTKIFRSGLVAALFASASALGAVPAIASTVGPTAADLALFAETGFTGSDPDTNQTFSVPGAVGFSSVWPLNYSGAATVDVGATLSIGYADGDVFRMKVANTNENPWLFELILDGTSVLSQTIANGASYVFAFALSGGGTINDVAVRVGATLPIIGPSGLPDRTA